MLSMRITLLVGVTFLILSCSDEDKPTTEVNVTSETNSSEGKNGGPSPAPTPIEPEPKKMGALHLYQNSSGAFFEILQLDEDPFSGIHYPDGFFDAQNKDPKAENVFKNGRLATRIEYKSPAIKKLELEFWDNGQIKHDIRFNSGGAPILTNKFNESGEILERNTSLAPGRRQTLYSGNRQRQGTIEYLFWNANTNLVRRDLGSPDKIEGNTWIYRNMNIVDTRNRQKRTTIRITFGSVATNIVVQP